MPVTSAPTMKASIEFVAFFVGIYWEVCCARAHPLAEKKALIEIFESFPSYGGEQQKQEMAYRSRMRTMAYSMRTKEHPSRCTGIHKAPDRVVKLLPKAGCVSHIQGECHGIMVQSDIILTAAHCLYGQPPKHGLKSKENACSDHCWEAVDSHGNSRSVSFTFRHRGYKEHVASDRQDMFRRDIAVAFLSSGLPISEAIGCLDAGQCANREEKCWMYKFKSDTIIKQSVNVDRCHAIDYNGCSGEDTLCVTDPSGQKLGAEKGDSGSPIVCEDKVGNFYVRGVLSQKDREDTFALFASVNRVDLVDYRGCR